MDLGDRSGDCPRQAQIEGQRRGDPPVILDEGPYDLPAAARDCAIECLVVDGASANPHQQVGHRIAGGCTSPGKVSGDTREQKAGSKGFCAYIHLIGTEIDADVNIVFAADQVEIVFEGVDVGSALKGGVAAIAE